MGTIYDNEETLPKIKNDLQDNNDILKNIRDSVYSVEKIDPYTMLGKLNQILKIKKGDKGDTGAQGIGVTAVNLTQENGLDFTLSNGEHLYTASVKGDKGNNGINGVSITGVTLTQENGLDFTLSNGEHLYTASVKGDKGDTGDLPDLYYHCITLSGQSINISFSVINSSSSLLYDNHSINNSNDLYRYFNLHYRNKKFVASGGYYYNEQFSAQVVNGIAIGGGSIRIHGLHTIGLNSHFVATHDLKSISEIVNNIFIDTYKIS